MNTVKIKLFWYITNNGDGSASPVFFSTREARDAYIEVKESSRSFEGFCESDGEDTFEVNTETGELIYKNPVITLDEEGYISYEEDND